MAKARCLPIEWTEVVGPRATLDFRPALSARGAIALRGQLSATDCARWVEGTYAARESWTADFGEEQFSLGRAFYTHFEQGRSAVYFKDACESDARVERYAPGLQSAMRSLAARVTGGEVRPRRGWCGPGIHVFPAGGHLAEHGGVVHFDREGLTLHQLAHHAPALSLVCMLQPPTTGGGLRIWDVVHEGPDTEEGEGDADSVLAVYETGDLVAIDSYRLHQIQPFAGDVDRISVTIHVAEVDAGHWESWF